MLPLSRDLMGQMGLNGAISSTKNELKEIIINIAVDIIAVGDFIKAKYISLSLILSINDKFLLSICTFRLHSNSWINKIIKNVYNEIYHYKYKCNEN